MDDDGIAVNYSPCLHPAAANGFPPDLAKIRAARLAELQNGGGGGGSGGQGEGDGQQ